MEEKKECFPPAVEMKGFILPTDAVIQREVKDEKNPQTPFIEFESGEIDDEHKLNEYVFNRLPLQDAQRKWLLSELIGDGMKRDRLDKIEVRRKKFDKNRKKRQRQRIDHKSGLRTTVKQPHFQNPT